MDKAPEEPEDEFLAHTVLPNDRTASDSQRGKGMKVLTVQQPYASLIASGDKWIENRTWETSFRGPLLIHAGLSSGYLSKEQLAKYPTGVALCVADVEQRLASDAAGR